MASQQPKRRVRTHQMLRVSLPPLDGGRSDNLFIAPSTRSLNKVVGLDERFLIEPPAGFNSSNRFSCDENGPPPSPNWGTSENRREGEDSKIVTLVLQLSLENAVSKAAEPSGAGSLEGEHSQVKQQEGRSKTDVAASPSSASSSNSKYSGSWFEDDDDDADDKEPGEKPRELHRSASLHKLEGTSIPNDIRTRRENALARLDGEVRSRNRDYSEYPEDLRGAFEHFKQMDQEAADRCRHMEIMAREVMAEKRTTMAKARTDDNASADEPRPPHGGQLLRSQLLNFSPISEGWRFLAWDEKKLALLLHLKQVETVSEDGLKRERQTVVTYVRNLNACSRDEYLEAMKEAADADWRAMIWVGSIDEDFPTNVPWPSSKTTMTVLSVR